jgi:hypothetical protein
MLTCDDFIRFTDAEIEEAKKIGLDLSGVKTRTDFVQAEIDLINALLSSASISWRRLCGVSRRSKVSSSRPSSLLYGLQSSRSLALVAAAMFAITESSVMVSRSSAACVTCKEIRPSAVNRHRRHPARLQARHIVNPKRRLFWGAFHIDFLLRKRFFKTY